ncbi:DUF305 domain-containing protein [Aurantimicrobium minutum]|uniref:DUF305 domain-containing protein n=1 Tax=Aurantimicrobium minutum TaxID=708131 RepID=UPI002476175C|nr:DUF305 domain-containing protein [Aurantimicrobium minutum]MDH6254980.1 uncharacterized protein (DUF305 family) [Aurantimicrobium minutum]MDH6409806.1 uncharacterized protein (DUF305 family) [Aurantimicrobium minutum]MDH6535853.1 uncharacterized protein (DUF305 family) [Aurantimicrobium minutum]
MFNKKYRIAGITAVALAGAISLAGCTTNLGGNDSNGTMDGGMMGNNKSASAFSGTDIMFAQMMIPHHQQAVDMSTLAETRTTNPEVLALAKQIKDAQAPEIKQMTAWIESSGSSTDMGHDMGMGGMLTDEQMTALENAQGAAFDKLYLEGMIGHHEGALQMATMIENSSNSEAKELAANIIKSQSAEIEKMKQMLEAL